MSTIPPKNTPTTISGKQLQTPNKHTATIHQISRWFEKAVPNPDTRNFHSQLGVHLEEVCEMLLALGDAGSTFSSREQVAFGTQVLDFLQRRIKATSDGCEFEIRDINRIELLDALCDQIVTAIGVAHMLSMDIEGALQEVADSNDSKFDPQGNPLFNEQRKIMKGPNYFAPDLGGYIHKEAKYG